eukprot:s860_g4.t1
MVWQIDGTIWQRVDRDTFNLGNIAEHRIKCKAASDFVRQGRSAPRRQCRIDWKIDDMCTKDRIQGIRRYIRQLNGSNATMKDDLPPRPHTTASAGELPRLVRHGPRIRDPPRGAEESRDVSVVYAAVAAKRKKIPQAPKCLLPVPGLNDDEKDDTEGQVLDLRGMNLTDDEARRSEINRKDDGRPRKRSRSPRGGLNTRRISSALCALGRYPKHQPEGLEVDDGTFELENLMEAWGHRQGLTKDDILDSVNAHMFQDTSTRALRDWRRGRQGHRFDREMWRDQKRWNRSLAQPASADTDVESLHHETSRDDEVTDNEEEYPGGMAKTEEHAVTSLALNCSIYEPDVSPWPLLNAKVEEGASFSSGWAKTEEVENPRRKPFTWAKQESQDV